MSINALLSTIFIGVLIGTYLDLFFVGKGIYVFPKRPLPNVFQINIAFTLFGLPIFICLFLFVSNLLKSWQKIWFIFIISLFMSVFERISESFGFFIHLESWKHTYSLIGYIIYLSFIYIYYQALNH
ncbi:hypothetical protein EKO25_01545 [Bacillus sp. SAJ1]|nr:hypothetical protein EKO25_01545 [Bacillus sp. SAJ1]